MKAYILDTFTKTPYKGNPTAVCWVDDVFPASSMQSIASELHFPVTAFLFKRGQRSFDIRYFTATTEIGACGHATLAAAATVFDREPAGPLNFTTITGLQIPVDAGNDLIRMNYPVYTTTALDVPLQLLSVMGLPAFEWLGYCQELETLFIRVTTARQLRDCAPDFVRMMQASPANVKEIVITALSDDPAYDFLLRSFCPWIGIDEDPVTGSVHSVLAAYWKEQLNRERLNAYQASARGGDVFLEVSGDKLVLAGHCVILFRGELALELTNKNT